MKYRNFGKLDIKVSALGFGAMRLPVSNGAINEKEAIKMIHYVVDHGLNYIDTAYIYHEGKSEKLVGKALKNGYRDKVHLATKLPSWKVDAVENHDQSMDIRAACCTGCEECESKCPQNITISRWMPVIHQVMAEGRPFKMK
jgi:uncharacterized protein